MTKRQILDAIADVESLVLSVQELTQQLMDLSPYPDKLDQSNAIDTARIATQEKLNASLKALSYSIEYDRELAPFKWEKPIYPDEFAKLHMASTGNLEAAN